MCNRQPHPATRRSHPPEPHRLQGGELSSVIPPLVVAGGRKSPPEKGAKGDSIFSREKCGMSKCLASRHQMSEQEAEDVS